MNVTKNIILGVMGKIGSGKSALINILDEKYIVRIFSADDVFKDMQKAGEFDSLNDNIEINTKLFQDEKLQERIRKVYHPKVFEKINNSINRIKKTGEEYDFIIIETALPSDDFLKMCDKTIYVENDEKIKTIRLMNDRNYSETKTKTILESQKYYEKFYDKADYRVKNDGDIIDLTFKVDFVIKELRGQI